MPGPWPTSAGSGDTLAVVPAAGELVECTATVDDDGGSASASSSLTISNSAPTVDSLSLSPSSPTTSDAVTATVVASDTDGDSLTLSYAWTVDGIPVANVSGNVLDSSHFVKLQTISVTVTATDTAEPGHGQWQREQREQRAQHLRRASAPILLGMMTI